MANVDLIEAGKCVYAIGATGHSRSESSVIRLNGLSLETKYSYSHQYDNDDASYSNLVTKNNTISAACFNPFDHCCIQV